MLPVSVESFDFLKQCMAGQADIKAASIEEIQELIREGYLRTESVVQEIRHPYTPYLKYFLDRKLAKITLQVTQGCNLRCKYCIYSEDINVHQRSHSSKRMSWETAKEGIDFLWKHSIDSPKINIGFYGGEPLLEFPLIKRAVAYARDIFDGKQLSFSITTNGTLLNPEIISFFEKEDVMLTISLDGPKDIHDQSRVFANGQGSFDTVMRNIAILKKSEPDYARKLSFSMVMDPINDYDCINQITLGPEALNEHIFMSSIVDRDYDNEEVIYSEQYTWKAQYQEFLAILSVLGRYPGEKISAISRGGITTLLKDASMLHELGPLRRIDAPSGPCVPGQLRLFVNSDGDLFPCERVSENSKAVCIGTLDNGFDLDSVLKILNVGAISKESCKNCWSFRYCTLCAKRVDDGTENLSMQFKLSHCNEVRSKTYAKFRRILLLNEAEALYAEQIRG